MDADNLRVRGHQGARPTKSRPSYKLSVELLATYKHINELFYEAKRKRDVQGGDSGKPIHNDGYDDDQGNYIVQTGEEVAGRYIVQEMLGKGSFGVVVKALDHRREECVAIKIIKNKVQFYHQAKVEIEILTKLNTSASDDSNIVKLKKVFTWKEHLCLVFELLSFNLYDLLKYTKFNGVSLNLIRKFAYQLLKTLDFLSTSPIGVIHCDLKPENILLKNPKRSGIKVIDFGSSCFDNKKMFKYIQSRFYRSPEVILGLGYDRAIDMWSSGCILVELHTGQAVFDGRDEAEQLLKIAAVLTPPPQKLAEASPKRKNFFQWDSQQKKWTLTPPNRDPARYPRSTLEEILGVHTGGPGGRRLGQSGHSEADYLQFVDLIKKMFCYNAAFRITPAAALLHPFLHPVHPDFNTAKILKSPAVACSSPRERTPHRSRSAGKRIGGGGGSSSEFGNYDQREGRPQRRLGDTTSSSSSSHISIPNPPRHSRNSSTHSGYPPRPRSHSHSSLPSLLASYSPQTHHHHQQGGYTVSNSNTYISNDIAPTSEIIYPASPHHQGVSPLRLRPKQPGETTTTTPRNKYGPMCLYPPDIHSKPITYTSPLPDGRGGGGAGVKSHYNIPPSPTLHNIRSRPSPDHNAHKYYTSPIRSRGGGSTDHKRSPVGSMVMSPGRQGLSKDNDFVVDWESRVPSRGSTGGGGQMWPSPSLDPAVFPNSPYGKSSHGVLSPSMRRPNHHHPVHGGAEPRGRSSDT